MKIKFSSQQLGVAILLFGIVLRLIVFGQNRSLFIDEANLARNIVEGDFSAFFQVLNYDQYAPPLFLCISKCFTFLFGVHEWSLRMWPLLAGMLSLWLLLRISEKLNLTGLACLIPVTWMAFSALFVRYHTEVKQYSSDAMISLLLIYLIIRSDVFQPETGTFHPPASSFYLSWGMLGVFAPWLSMPSVFILFGIGCFVGIQFWRAGAQRSLLFWVLILLSWLVSFAIYYLLILRLDLDKDVLVDYHSQFSFPINWFDAAAWPQAGGVLKSILRSTFGYTFLAYVLGGLGLTWGLWVMYRRSSPLLWIIGLPILTSWIASAFGYYSLIPRLTLFFIPLLYLIFAHAFQELENISVRLQNREWSLRYLLLIPIIVLLPLQKGQTYLWSPLEIEELRPILVQLNEEIRSPKPVYINHEAGPAFAFYQELHHLQPYLKQIDEYIAPWDAYPAAWLENLPAEEKEVWLLYSHLISTYSTERMNADLGGIPAGWQAGKQLQAEGAKAIQYVRKNH